MLLIIIEYTDNMIVHTHSKYTFVNFNISNYIFQNTKVTPLYILKAMTKLVTFASDGHKLVFWDEM